MYKTFARKINLIFMQMKTHFHMTGFGWRLVLTLAKDNLEMAFVM